jgi:hypothetical protein
MCKTILYIFESIDIYGVLFAGNCQQVCCLCLQQDAAGLNGLSVDAESR